jgi:hypothetical protein
MLEHTNPIAKLQSTVLLRNTAVDDLGDEDA